MTCTSNSLLRKVSVDVTPRHALTAIESLGGIDYVNDLLQILLLRNKFLFQLVYRRL